MPNFKSYVPENRFMALFVGQKHSGKTVAACSCITAEEKLAGKKVYDFDFDGRIEGLLSAPYNTDHIDHDYFPPKVGLEDKSLTENLHRKCNELIELIRISRNPYTTIVADSLTSECAGLLMDSLLLTHSSQPNGQKKGKYLGALPMTGPEDYGAEANGTYQFISFLRSIPVKNIIVTAHITDKFGKADPNNPFSESIVTGEKLSIRDKIGVNTSIYFNHIFKFERRMVGGREHFFVKFRSNIACTSYPQLPAEEVDITGKDFYNEVLLPALRAPQAEVKKI